jgi:hypothetical protein
MIPKINLLKLVVGVEQTHIHLEIMHHIFFAFLSGVYMLVCPFGSRLQRVLLLFFFLFFFFSLYRFFFLFEQNLLSSPTYICICVRFCVLCLTIAMTDQMQSIHELAFCAVLSFFSCIIILVLSPS